MPEVNAGELKYRYGQTPGFDAAVAVEAGDAVAMDSSGNLVLADGSNGFLGVARMDAAAGDKVAVHLSGVVRANVTAGVAANNALSPSGSEAGALTAGGTPAAAGTGELKALTDADADGFALVRV